MFKILKKRLLLFVLTLLITSVSIAQSNETTLVSNITEFNTAMKKATPGSKIVLKNGVWKDVHIKAHGIGTKEAPILITAETDGQVIINGDSRLNISGKYLIIKGLWFKDGTPTASNLIEFRKDSKNFAYNCRLTHCTVSYFNPKDNSQESRWVNLWGKNNRVDHNNFTGKTNGGTTLVVWLKGEEHTKNNHQIDHNFFGFRPDLGENGGETIRIGTSTNSMKSSKSIVEFNTFKHCNGEIEIISNKSGENIFRNNLFLESEGTLTLRHGNNALVENNVFIGNNNRKSGGIRIINEGHTVQNNLLVNVIGDDYRGPLVVMNGVPNSPLNRYNQVKNVSIQNNTLINCSPVQFGAGKDNEKTLPAISSVFANNLITNTTGGDISNEQDVVSGIQFFGNIVESSAAVNPAQFTKATIDWELLKSVPMPTKNNPILKTVKKTDRSPELDMCNSKRVEYVAGAFNLGNTIFPSIITTKTGPYWKPVIEERKPDPSKNTEVIVEPGIQTISKALKNAGKNGTLILNPGTYIVESTMKISGDITIEGNTENGEIILKSSEDLEKGLSYFFRVNEGSRFHLKNVTLDAESKIAVKYGIVSPDENMGGLYNVYIDNCTFNNFTNSNGAIYKAYAGTFADTVSIKNSRILNSYRGLNVSYEKSALGKTNAQYIILQNTLFKNISQFAVNYYRNSINPLVQGGNLIVDHCVFSKVYNTPKGYIFKTNGITNVDIKNSVFENSHEIVTPISLSGTSNSINNCLIFASGNVKISKNAIKLDVVYKSPKWEDRKLFIPSNKSPLLKENNGIENIGLLTPLKL